MEPPIINALKRHFNHVFNGEKISALSLDSNLYKAKIVKFINSEFLGNLQFNGVNLSHGLTFLDCNFSGSVSMQNVIVDSYDHSLNPESESIKFKNCVFENIVSIKGKSEIERGLVFDNCTFKKGLEIYFIDIKTEGLRIKDCKVYEKLDVFNSHFKQGISISNNAINTYLRLEHIKGSSISFTSDNIIKEQLRIDDCQLENGIVFNNGTFKDDVNFSVNATRSSGLTIIGSTFEKTVSVDHHHHDAQPERGISKYYLSECKFQNGIYINGNKESESKLLSIVEEITINSSDKLIGEIHFRNLDVGVVNLKGFNSSANIVFKNVYINEFNIKSFINNAGLIISLLKSSIFPWFDKENNIKLIESTFNIDDSNLGRAQFYRIDFPSYKNIKINNTIISEISTSLVNWFDDKTLNQENFKSVNEQIKNLKEKNNSKDFNFFQNLLVLILQSNREVFRQLKYVSQKQGDIPQSLAFQRVEMRYYRQINKLEKPWWRSESIILWSNHFSNDFGQSWLRALGLLIGFSFLLYIPIGFLTSDALDYSRVAKSWSELVLNFRVVFCDNIKQWLVTLNPTHRIKDITDNIDQYSKWVYFWDLFSRIIVSYFIFQMIYAFRKFNK